MEEEEKGAYKNFLKSSAIIEEAQKYKGKLSEQEREIKRLKAQNADFKKYITELKSQLAPYQYFLSTSKEAVIIDTIRHQKITIIKTDDADEAAEKLIEIMNKEYLEKKEKINEHPHLRRMLWS